MYEIGETFPNSIFPVFICIINRASNAIAYLFTVHKNTNAADDKLILHSIVADFCRACKFHLAWFTIIHHRRRR